jgi:hypothetical protein
MLYGLGSLFQKKKWYWRINLNVRAQELAHYNHSAVIGSILSQILSSIN